MKKNLCKVKTIILIILLLIVVVFLGIYLKNEYELKKRMEFVRQLGSGFNVGNALESTGFREHNPKSSELDCETFWGNPKITEEQLQCIKRGGFKTVRIPVTWEEHIDEQGQISNVWMERVQEVVDMALEQELYVILNTHHEDWLDLKVENSEEICKRYALIWQQIGEKFADYDQHLLLEGMNEPRLKDSEYEWTSGTKEMRMLVNKLNDIFVQAVRNTGSQNENRYLLITPYGNNSSREALEDLEVFDGNIIVSVHLYKPYEFCNKDGNLTQWENNSEQAREVMEIYNTIDEVFISKKIPVIITEFGCEDKNNLDERIKWTEFYKNESDKYGIPCIWWDNGSGYRILDRENCQWVYPEILKVLVSE